eukprot:tig00000405_g480.t1
MAFVSGVPGRLQHAHEGPAYASEASGVSWNPLASRGRCRLPVPEKQQWSYQRPHFSLYAHAGRGRPPSGSQRRGQVSRQPIYDDDDTPIPWTPQNLELIENFLADLNVSKPAAPTAKDFEDAENVINLSSIDFDEDGEGLEEEEDDDEGWLEEAEDDDDQFEISFGDDAPKRAPARQVAAAAKPAKKPAAAEAPAPRSQRKEAATAEKSEPARPAGLRSGGRQPRIVCQFKAARFVKSAMSKQEWPVPRDRQRRFLPEVAVLGHANAGKSSLLNDLWQSPGLAKTSSVPGCTRALDFFDVDSLVSLVDVPGYGYSVVPEEERLRWPEMFTDFFGRRKQLKLIMFVVDMRHEIVFQDKAMRNYIEMSGKPGLLILTKADLVNKAERQRRAREIMQAVRWNPEDPYLFYSVKGGARTGREDLVAVLNDYLFNGAAPGRAEAE